MQYLVFIVPHEGINDLNAAIASAYGDPEGTWEVTIGLNGSGIGIGTPAVCPTYYEEGNPNSVTHWAASIGLTGEPHADALISAVENCSYVVWQTITETAANDFYAQINLMGLKRLEWPEE